MGEVYEALDQNSQARVALKVVTQTSSTEHEAITRFETEGRALASVRHPISWGSWVSIRQMAFTISPWSLSWHRAQRTALATLTHTRNGHCLSFCNSSMPSMFYTKTRSFTETSNPRKFSTCPTTLEDHRLCCRKTRPRSGNRNHTLGNNCRICQIRLARSGVWSVSNFSVGHLELGPDLLRNARGPQSLHRKTYTEVLDTIRSRDLVFQRREQTVSLRDGANHWQDDRKDLQTRYQSAQDVLIELERLTHVPPFSSTRLQQLSPTDHHLSMREDGWLDMAFLK